MDWWIFKYITKPSAGTCLTEGIKLSTVYGNSGLAMMLLNCAENFFSLQAAIRNLNTLRYTWIIHGWYPNQWWTQAVANEAIACSDAKLEAFLAKSRTLAVSHFPVPTDLSAKTAAGIVSYDATMFTVHSVIL